jgi:hypothetical protein
MAVVIMDKSYLLKFIKDVEKNPALSMGMVPTFSQTTSSALYMLPTVLFVGALTMYVIIIWYRDFSGKNTLAYRLFMLPTSRMTVYFAKATTIVLSALSFTVYQLVIFAIGKKIFEMGIADKFLEHVSIRHMMAGSKIIGQGGSMIMFPTDIPDFFFVFGLGFAGVLVIFTMILLERSYRLKGIVLSVLYGVLIVVIGFVPLLTEQYILDQFHTSLYVQEMFLLELGLAFLITVLSVFLSKYLLKHKVTL